MFKKILNTITKLFPFLICFLLAYFAYIYENGKVFVYGPEQNKNENENIQLEDELSISYGKPIHITIDSVHIDLDILEGEYDYDSQTWTVSKGYAYWANLSDPILSSTSTTVVYAHNQKGEFYNLKYIREGDRIRIVTDNGNELVFTYQYDQIVLPENSSVIFEKEETSRLVLITCDGIWSQSRRVLYATLD